MIVIPGLILFSERVREIWRERGVAASTEHLYRLWACYRKNSMFPLGMMVLLIPLLCLIHR